MHRCVEDDGIEEVNLTIIFEIKTYQIIKSKFYYCYFPQNNFFLIQIVCLCSKFTLRLLITHIVKSKCFGNVIMKLIPKIQNLSI